MKVSIIVPVYNASKTLRRCVDSILTQKGDLDLEVLLINDGSTDDSAVICKEYVKLGGGKIVYIEKENGGVSSARNVGLNHSTGDGVIFVDSDDYILPDFVCQLANHNADIVISGCLYTGSGHGENLCSEEYVNEEHIGEYLGKYLNTKPIGTPWGKLFQRDIIEHYHIRYDERMHVGEDHVFVCEYLLHCKSIFSTSYTGYCYWSNLNSFAQQKYGMTDDYFRIFYTRTNSVYQALFERFQFQIIPSTCPFAVTTFLKSQEKSRFKFKGIKDAKNCLKMVPSNVYDSIANQKKDKFRIIFRLMANGHLITPILIFRFVVPIVRKLKP